MWKRGVEGTGIVLLIVVATFYVWTEGIADPAQLHGSKRVEIESSAGAVDVVGQETSTVEVSVDGEAPSDHGTRVSIDQNHFPVRVKIANIPNGAHVQVSVPSEASVAARMSAGRLRISGVTGDVVALLRSGEMIVTVKDPNRLESAEGSVLAGEARATIFNRKRGGLFCMFHWNGHGTNLLHAHVTTGRLLVQ